MADTQRTWLAVSLMLVAIVGFDSMGVMVRLLSERGYGAAELSAYRNILGIIPSLILLAYWGELRLSGGAMKVKRWKLALFRGLVTAVAQVCYYSALAHLELATVSALAQTHALFVVLISVVLMGERVGPWRIFALILGFAGAIWVLRPGGDSFTPIALLPIIAAACYAFSVVSVRFFDSSASNPLLYPYASFASALGAIAIALLGPGFSPIGASGDLALIFGMSMAGGIAVLLMMIAYRMAPPSLLAPFAYLSILSAFTFGWLIFDEAPVDTLFPGILFIIAAGVLIIWREQFVRAKDPNTT